MTKTAEDIVTKAFQSMGRIAPSEAPDHDMMKDGLEEYTAFHAVIQVKCRDAWMLRSRTWSKDSVPDEIAPHIEKMLAEYMADQFPVDDVKYQKIANAATRAEAHLKRVLSRPKKSFNQFADLPTSARYEATINS